MRRVSFNRYGPPSVLEVTTAPEPECAPDEYLVRVHAASLNSGDSHMRKGEPFMARLYNGLFRPKRITSPGFTFSGEIISVGAELDGFGVGDEVFGSRDMLGTLCDVIQIGPKDRIAKKPEGISHVEAAAIPFGGLSALYFLRDLAGLQPGSRVLVYGASGALGSAAVELATKHFKAKVYALCSAKNAEMVRALGADEVEDYQSYDFASASKSFDLVFDAVGKLKTGQGLRMLKKGGRFVTSAFGFGLLLRAGLAKLFSSKSVRMGIASNPQEDLELLSALTKEGNFVPFIDKVYPLDAIVEAAAYVDSGRKRGSVIVSLVGEQPEGTEASA